jgi:acyl-CoA dehydrogenase
MMGDRPWEIAFQDVEVPKHHLVGLEGGGFELAQGWLTRNRIAHHGARVVGIGKRALDLMARRAAERTTFGKPLADRQAVTEMVSKSAIELKTAELLVYDTARKFDAGEPVRNESFMVKLHCTEVGLQVVDRAMQVFGAIGLSSDYPLEYFFRQLRSLQITEGPREVLSWRLGRRIIREVAESSS